MTQPQLVPTGAAASAQRPSGGGRALGFVLLLPALLAWVVYQVLPVLRTLLHSVREGGLGSPGGFVGLANFQRIPGPWYVSVLENVLLGLLMAAVGVLVGIGVGTLVRRAPLGWQRVTLGVLAGALVTYAPVNLVIAGYWGSAQQDPATLRFLLAMLPVPILVGALAGALVRSGKLLVVIGAVTALGGGAWAAQGETGLLIAAPQDSGAFIYRSTFSMFDIPLGAAASTLLGLLVGALGLGAGLLLLAVGPRFDLRSVGRVGRLRSGAGAAPFGGREPAPFAGPAAAQGAVPATYGASPGLYGRGQPAAGPGRSAAGVLAALAAGVALVVLALLAWPWLQHLGDGVEGIDPAQTARVTWSTVGRRALEVLVVVLVTGAAAFGIGYLRPFGRHNLRVLLVFSPWLFAGLVPLMTGLSFHLDGAHGDPPFFGISGQLLAVPLLFLLAYLADGLRVARDGGARPALAPVVGLVVLGVGVLALTRAQSVVWDLVFLYQNPSSAIVQLMQVVSMRFGQTLPLGLLTPIPVLVVGALLLAGAGALVPGARVLPAAELDGRLPAYGPGPAQQAPTGPYSAGQYPQPVPGQYPQPVPGQYPSQQYQPQQFPQPVPGQYPSQPPSPHEHPQQQPDPWRGPRP